jgi:hypothetical protein
MHSVGEVAAEDRKMLRSRVQEEQAAYQQYQIR